MNVIKIAAFSHDQQGGNPAGVVLTEQELPTAELMQTTAADVGFSETVFAAKQDDKKTWRVKYFSPEAEVPFCGHATIALGAVLAKEHGDGVYTLNLNDSQITVEGAYQNNQYTAALQSPLTKSESLENSIVQDILTLFGYQQEQLDDSIQPARIHGGADHFVLALKQREDLGAMNYDLNAGREFMHAHGIVTIMFVYIESEQIFHVRNAFASGGVLEDPATGAAAAAFSGYLRDIEWPHLGKIQIMQGEDMGQMSSISTTFDLTTGSSIRVSGHARDMKV